MAAHVGQGDLCRLLHHVAELTGQGETGLAVHGRGLDEQHVATCTGHGQTSRHARDRGPDRRLLEVALAPERIAHCIEVDDHGCGCRAGRDLRRGLAQQRPEVTLELADSRLARVLGGDGAEQLV